MKIAALVSGGKDSILALYEAGRMHKPVCIIAIKSKNPESYMFHTPAIEMVKLQARAMGLPLVWRETAGEKETELEDLKDALEEAKEKYGAEGIVSGALYSKYQKDRIDALCFDLGLQSIAPLWQSAPVSNWDKMLRLKFEVMITGVAAYGLGQEWLGKVIDKQAVKQLQNLHGTCYVCTGGEGGEFETLVLDCPLFDRKLKVEKSHTEWDEKTQSGVLVIDKAKLVEK